jgi:YidC/Oxa1 family membrane protein insertase
MEQGRLFLAIALSLLVFFLWEILFVNNEAVRQSEQTQHEEPLLKEEPYIRESEKDRIEKFSLDKLDKKEPFKEVRTITVNTPLYSVKISEKGAVFKSLKLKNYRETIDADSPFLEMISSQNHTGTVLLGFTGGRLEELRNAVFSTKLSVDSLDVYDRSKEVSFYWVSDQGVVVEKRFVFSPETYRIGLNVVIKNGSNQSLGGKLFLSLMKSFQKEPYRIGFEGPSALINNKLEQIKIKKIKNEEVFAGKLKWIAVQDRYFISAVIPKRTVEAGMRLFFNPDNILENRYLQPVGHIDPGTQHAFEYQIFFGPKNMKILGKSGYDLHKAVNFGVFDFIARPCVWLLNFLYGLIPNYGFAIIILTLFVKLLLWPLGNKSYKSMNEMKKLQPLMVEIREKYKADKKKMNEEIMGLYKTYKVNPMSGCLPMVVQIPIFFALYRMLY